MAVKSAIFPIYGYASTLLGDRIYVFGGANYNKPQTEIFNAVLTEGTYLRLASFYDIRMDT